MIIAQSTYTLPKILNKTEESIFFEKPKKVPVNEGTRYAPLEKIETLIAELKEKGPLVAEGSIGPVFYSVKPLKLENQVCKKDIYYWERGSERVEALGECAIILGAKKLETSAFVYFTMSGYGPNLGQNQNCMNHEPSKTDVKIYVVSFNTFKNSISALYAPLKEAPLVFGITSTPNQCPELTPSEREYVTKLSAIKPLDSILDRGEGEERCKSIGQAIFNTYKIENNDNSFKGKEAVQKICNAVHFFADDGRLRKEYIERAWDGIGDNNWRWMA